MATVLRGKHKGKTVTILQWCNDWFSTDLGIFSPTSLKFNHEEMMKVLQSKDNGMLLQWYEPTFDLIFKKKSRFKSK